MFYSDTFRSLDWVDVTLPLNIILDPLLKVIDKNCNFVRVYLRSSIVLNGWPRVVISHGQTPSWGAKSCFTKRCELNESEYSPSPPKMHLPLLKFVWCIAMDRSCFIRDLRDTRQSISFFFWAQCLVTDILEYQYPLSDARSFSTSIDCRFI